MSSTYNFRIIMSSWGIAIDITAEAISRSDYSGDATEIKDGLWLAIETNRVASNTEHQYLATGLRLVAKEMQNVIATNGPLVVRVLDIWFVPTDYQEEGLACALAGWMSQQFGVTYQMPHVHFDNGRNRYEFDFPET
jgi:hypothetical protein